MLLAYIDEIGEPGAFVSKTDKRYNTNPAFGYAGFIIPEEKSREFAAMFHSKKLELYPRLAEHTDYSGVAEVKGSSLFRAKTPREFPQSIRVFASLVEHLKNMGGELFYYADEKPLGSPKAVNLVREDIEASAMEETLNRLATSAEHLGQNILIMMDQINEEQRKRCLPEMYAHILGRTSHHKEMQRIVEPPMHIDSQLSSNIQFADWVAALCSRAIEDQLLEHSDFGELIYNRGLHLFQMFTYESKLHMLQRRYFDINNSALFGLSYRKSRYRSDQDL